MLEQRSLSLGVGTLLAAWLACGSVQAAEVRGNLSLLGQVREGDQSRETEAPNDVYGDMGVAGLHHGTSVDTYFRLEHDFGREQSTGDFYAGVLRAPAAIPGVDLSLGRQFLSEAPGAAFVADAGKVRIDGGWPVVVTLFGGQPRYFEPTFPPERVSQDEQVFGGSIRTTRWKGGSLSLGYLQQDRDHHEVRQLITGNWARAFTRWPGLPRLYGSVAYDADRQNIDLGSAGVDVFLWQPRLLFNFEGSYYKPQDQGQYLISRSVSAYADYSYQRYEKLASAFENGHVASAGLLWLPGGDGLEVVRVEYYVVDSDGGNVNGGKALYESRVYERLVLRTKIDVSHYEKENNERDTAVSSLLGLGCVILPGLVWEVDFEANHNKRFDEDFRFGFLITYNFRHRFEKPKPTRGDS